MKKHNRILLKTVRIIAAVLLVCFAALFFYGTCFQRFRGASESMANWMSYVADDTSINRIAIPGSHDAGTKGVIWPAETQSYTIEEQLLSGARYFDIRVHKKGDRLVIYHAFIDGGDFGEVIDEIKAFITAHKSEALFLDFQHFKGDSQSAVYDMLLDKLGDALLVRNDTSLDDLSFIRSLTIQNVRGKCIVFWGDRSVDSSEYLFLRNNDDCTGSDMCLDSYYIGSKHTSGANVLIGEAHPIYFKKLDDRIADGTNGIFVLQCQLTDGKAVFGPWSLERKNDPILSEYIWELRNDEHLNDINIIMRDFITPQKCIDIIILNYYKGIMTRLF